MLQIFDFWSTLKILNAGGIELNPVEKWLMDKADTVIGLLIIKIPVCIVFACLFCVVPCSAWLTILFGFLDIYYLIILWKNNFQNI